MALGFRFAEAPDPLPQQFPEGLHKLWIRFHMLSIPVERPVLLGVVPLALRKLPPTSRAASAYVQVVLVHHFATGALHLDALGRIPSVVVVVGRVEPSQERKRKDVFVVVVTHSRGGGESFFFGGSRRALHTAGVLISGGVFLESRRDAMCVNKKATIFKKKV